MAAGNQAPGSKSRILYQSEAAFKTTATASAAMLPFVSETLRLTRNLVESEAITTSRDYQMPRRGQYEVGGSIELEINGTMNHLMRHVFGSVSSSASGSAYKHTFTIGDLPAGLTIEKGFAVATGKTSERYFLYNGCKVNRFSMRFEPSGMIRGTIDFLGAKESTSGGSYLAPGGTPAVNLAHRPFDGFEITLKQGGTTLGICTALEWALENNLDGNVYVIDGTGERYDLPEGRARVSGTVTALFESSTMYDLAVAHTTTSIEAIIVAGSGNGITDNERMEILFSEVKFSPQAPVTPGMTGVLVELPFTAFKGTGSTTMQMILLNQRPNSTSP